jgi:hypothetical protein
MFSYLGCGSNDGEIPDAGEIQVEVGDPAEIQPGFLIVHNSCSKPLTIMVPPGKTIQQFVLQPGASSTPFSLTDVGTNMGFKPAPNISAEECTSVSCSGWKSVLDADQCREASQWEGDNTKYASYCNPALVVAGTCDSQDNCCGPGMVQDYGFGTFFEISIQAPNDNPDISTNSNCQCGSGEDLCTEGSPIFYNVPMKWTTNNDCSMGSAGKSVKGAECTSVTCPDAYTHPTDDKQVSCPNDNTNRGYVLEYCPDNNNLPAI